MTDDEALTLKEMGGIIRDLKTAGVVAHVARDGVSVRLRDKKTGRNVQWGEYVRRLRAAKNG